jgi:hypothetical protein
MMAYRGVGGMAEIFLASAIDRGKLSISGFNPFIPGEGRPQ